MWIDSRKLIDPPGVQASVFALNQVDQLAVPESNVNSLKLIQGHDLIHLHGVAAKLSKSDSESSC